VLVPEPVTEVGVVHVSPWLGNAVNVTAPLKLSTLVTVIVSEQAPPVVQSTVPGVEGATVKSGLARVTITVKVAF
jgi:hypothetical protein